MKANPLSELAELLGYEPMFCDATIKEFQFGATSRKIAISLDYEDRDQSIVLSIDLRMTGVSAVDLAGIKDQNVIDRLLISWDGPPFNVAIESAVGIYGTFQCLCTEVTFDIKEAPPGRTKI